MSISVQGLPAADAQLERLQRAAADPSGAWPGLAEVFADAETGHFGRAPWPALSADYAARKARRYPGRPLEVATGNLRGSLTDAQRVIITATKKSVRMGSNVIYARYQKRRVLVPARTMREAWTQRLEAYMQEAAK